MAETDRIANFTLRTQKVFRLANQEAHRLNHDSVRTEHLLLGLLKDGIGLASRVLRDLNCYLPSGRSGLEKIAPATPEVVTVGKLPWTVDVQRVMDRARREAKTLLDPNVGTGHVLLALLSESPELVARVIGKGAPSSSQICSLVVAGLKGTNWAEVEDYGDYDTYYGPRPELGPST